MNSEINSVKCAQYMLENMKDVSFKKIRNTKFSCEYKWISVEDKLPKPLQQVTFLINGWRVEQGFMCEDGNFYLYGLIRVDKELVELEPIIHDRIHAWMPLPEAPR